MVRIWSLLEVEGALNQLPQLTIMNTRVLLCQEVDIVFILVDYCRLYKILPLSDLSQCNQVLEPR